MIPTSRAVNPEHSRFMTQELGIQDRKSRCAEYPAKILRRSDRTSDPKPTVNAFRQVTMPETGHSLRYLQGLWSAYQCILPQNQGKLRLRKGLQKGRFLSPRQCLRLPGNSGLLLRSPAPSHPETPRNWNTDQDISLHDRSHSQMTSEGVSEARFPTSV